MRRLDALDAIWFIYNSNWNFNFNFLFDPKLAQLYESPLIICDSIKWQMVNVLRKRNVKIKIKVKETKRKKWRHRTEAQRYWMAMTQIDGNSCKENCTRRVKKQHKACIEKATCLNHKMNYTKAKVTKIVSFACIWENVLPLKANGAKGEKNKSKLKDLCERVWMAKNDGQKNTFFQ